LRDRYRWESRELATTYAAAVAAMRSYYRTKPELRDRLSTLLVELRREFGVKATLAAALGGPYLRWQIRREQRRLADGWTYEPPTFYDWNDAMFAAAERSSPSATWIRSVVPIVANAPREI
jgi:hypothetical protein